MADVNSFLKLIKAMESSGGKDTAHKPVEEGIQQGDSAIGAYGLMPNTAKEMAGAGKIGPSDDVIKNLPNTEVSDLLKENPQLSEQYVKMLAEKLMNKTQGDPILGMTGWNQGHNLPLEDIKQRAKDNPDYINKVNQRIDENHLQSKVPGIMDMLKPSYKDEPISRKRK